MLQNEVVVAPREATVTRGTLAVTPKARKNWAHYVVCSLPLLALLLALASDLFVPDKQLFATETVYPLLLKGALGLYIVAFILAAVWRPFGQRLRNLAPLLTLGIVYFLVWELVTFKLDLLPLPYFPGPDKVLGYLVSDWQLLGESTLYSLRLLAVGYLIGAAIGLVTGVSIGWNKRIHYWIMPLLKIIGPVPATAWIPMALIIFPTSFWASVFLIALAVWFPVAIMTSSGIGNVRNAFFEVARTLGADQRYLIFKVAIPGAYPFIFIGLFMGLGGAFLTLIVAEMLGVKAGLGWYITWAQGWAVYAKVYAALIVIAVIFSSIITLLFTIRDRVLVWQKGVIKW
jgi:NitT/TauT family transport system permease protein